MAERRMFSKVITDTDAFLDMPLSAQALYFHLAMHADDDGFVSSPKKILRETKAGEDDYKLLIVKRFILTFDSGIIVIKHWKIHNLIQKDRYKETTYLEEKSMLTLDRKNAYVEKADTDCIQAVSEMDTQYRLGEGSAEQSSAEKGRIGEKGSAGGGTAPPKRFEKPTVEEIAKYCEERQNGIDPQQFFDFYESKGWKIGKEPMKDWRACVRTWEKREGAKPPKPTPNSKYNRED